MRADASGRWQDEFETVEAGNDKKRSGPGPGYDDVAHDVAGDVAQDAAQDVAQDAGQDLAQDET